MYPSFKKFVFCYYQPAIGCFGLAGNTASIIILSSQEMKNCFNRSIVANVVFVNFLDL